MTMFDIHGAADRFVSALTDAGHDLAGARFELVNLDGEPSGIRVVLHDGTELRVDDDGNGGVEIWEAAA